MIRVHESKDGQFYVTLVARNGQVLTTSETLKTLKSVRKNIKAQIRAFGGSGVRVVWHNGIKELVMG